MASIYLIRHGQASFGSENYDVLSARGERQAEVLGEYLRDCSIQFDAAYSGRLQRQRKTAEIALSFQSQTIDLNIDSRFDEINNEEQIAHLAPQIAAQRPDIQALVEGGLGDSKTYQKIIEAVFNAWVSGVYDAPIQSWQDYSANARAALHELMIEQGAGKTVAVFTSGGTIATLVAQALGLHGEHTYRFYEPVINCSVSRLFYRDGGQRVSLSYFNDHSYLDVLGRINGEQLITYR